MDATLIWLLGAFLPNIPDGTMNGKLAAIAVPAVVLTVLLRNFLRLIADLFFIF